MRPTFAEIDLSAISFNIHQIRKKVGSAQIMAVVKANAYGHGMVEVARTAVKSGAAYLGVALPEEGAELREKGFKVPILVFGGIDETQIAEFLKYDLELTLYSALIAKTLAAESLRLGKRTKVHIKVDTGMGRVGVNWEEACEFVRKVSELKGIEIKGLYTHFATSDKRDKEFAHLQLSHFRNVIDEIEKLGVHIPLKHTANSGAILGLPHSYFDMVRPGIMMYGYYPSPETTESVVIKPAMTLKSRVLFIKEVPEGTSISYDRKYITSRRTKIATVPIGYADGYNRLLTNTGEVLIRGRKFPVVGQVCMDQIMVDVGEDAEINEGDEVVLLGKQGNQEVRVWDICRKLNTIPYEVCCWVSRRVPRVYTGDYPWNKPYGYIPPKPLEGD